MIEIKIIDESRAEDVKLPNQPFTVWGRIIPRYVDGRWDHEVVGSDAAEVYDMRFPDEDYDFSAMSRDTVFIGAYDGEKCVGLAVLRDAFFKYMYLLDLKVNAEYRCAGVGSALISKARETAGERGYRGVYVTAQDNNATACLFYLKNGFRIGGLDTEVYKGTNQEGKSDIVFYIE